MVTIYHAHLTMLPDIQRFFREVWLNKFSHVLTPKSHDELVALVRDEGILYDALSDKNYYWGVARLEHDTIVGVIGAYFFDPYTIVIQRVCVDPEYQRKGTGRLLVGAARAAFPYAQYMRVEIERDHDGLSLFYRKLGFEEVGTDQEMTQHSSHLIVMNKDLT